MYELHLVRVEPKIFRDDVGFSYYGEITYEVDMSHAKIPKIKLPKPKKPKPKKIMGGKYKLPKGSPKKRGK